MKTFGGKYYLAKKIIPLFPPHDRYVEGCIAGGSILLNKEKVEQEIAIDINPKIINLWKTIQSHFVDFKFFVDNTDYDEVTFNTAMENNIDYNLFYHIPYALTHYIGNCQQSLNFLVKNRFSRGGMGKTFAWSDRLRGGEPGDVNAWNTFKKELSQISERVKDVDFYCKDIISSIDEFDSEDTLFYLDPPYLKETRVSKEVYEYEMSNQQHQRLIETILKAQGAVFISGYHSEMYDDMLSNWKLYEFPIANHSGQNKKKNKRLECLWTNVV